MEQLCTKMKYSGGIEEAKDTLDSALRLGYSAGVRTIGAHMDCKRREGVVLRPDYFWLLCQTFQVLSIAFSSNMFSNV